MSIGNKKTIIDFFFIISVLCAFAVSGILIVIFGAKIFSETKETIDDDFSERTEYFYIRNKIKAFDQEGAVAINGDKTPVLISEGDNGTFYTYIYVYDGYLKEITVRSDAVFDKASGNNIVKADSLITEIIDDNILKLTIISGDIEHNIYVSVLSGVNEIEKYN